MSDYISREAAMDILKDVFQTADSGSVERTCILIESIIKRLPTTDVVSRTAYEQVVWERDIAVEQLNAIGIRTSHRSGYGYKCSECGDIYHRKKGKLNYCPNCGAKMDGGDGDAAD